MNLRPYQHQAISGLQEKFKEGKKKVVLIVSTGGGKSLCKDTPVLMYDGSIKMCQDIIVGDIVMGDDSTPRNVLATSVGVEPCYEIIPSKGMKWRCNESHILTLKKYIAKYIDGKIHYDQKIFDVNLKDYLQLSNCQKNLYKQIRTGVEFNEQQVPIDPYFLGIWLGDGNSRLVSISTPDPEIKDYFNDYCKSFGLKVRQDEKREGFCDTWMASNERGKGNKILQILQSLNLIQNKHIPKSFLINSRENRLKLLAGLLDTDGYFHHYHYEISTKFEILKDDICFLARSLGFAAYWTYSEKQIKSIGFKGMYYRITISGDMTELPILIPRKKPKERRIKKDVLCTGFSVNPIGDQEYFGIELDGNHRFLLGDFTITHNTVIASQMIKKAVENGTRVLFLAHRKELVEQCHSKLLSFGVEAGIIMAGKKESRGLKVQVASIQTLSRRELPPAKLLIIDECHNSLSTTYVNLIKKYEEKGAIWLVGLTATPFRTKSNTEWLGMIYEDFVYPITTQQLIDEKFLVPTRVYACARISSAHFKKKGGDFDEEILMKAFDVRAVYINLISNFKVYAEKKKTIVFCCNVEHSKKTVQAFRDAGYTAEHVDGTTDPATRDRLVKDFKNGKFQILSNCQIFTEGTDIPDIECVILNLATTSKIKYLQSLGRGLRISPGKTECIVLDMSDNSLRFGFCEDIFEIDIHNENKNEKKGVPPTKECPECNRIVLARAKHCPECNYEFPVKPKEKKTPEEVLFEELDRKMVAAEKYRFYPKEKWNEVPTELLAAFAKLKGFHTGWVKHELARRNEGRKIVKILDYTDKDGGYWKMKNWLEKAYYDTTIRIPAETWQFVEETPVNIIFRYLPGKIEKEENLLF